MSKREILSQFTSGTANHSVVKLLLERGNYVPYYDLLMVVEKNQFKDVLLSNPIIFKKKQRILRVIIGRIKKRGNLKIVSHRYKKAYKLIK